MKAMGLVIGVVVAGGCGATQTSVRTSTYEVSLARLDEATAAAIAEVDYPVAKRETNGNWTSFEVGPLFFHPDKRRAAPTDVAEDGSYRVTLYVRTVSSKHDERYLDIAPAVFRFEQGQWKFRLPVTTHTMTERGDRLDPFAWDSWLASIADPIYRSVDARLKSNLKPNR
jgi:hypothetical protein